MKNKHCIGMTALLAGLIIAFSLAACQMDPEVSSFSYPARYEVFPATASQDEVSITARHSPAGPASSLPVLYSETEGDHSIYVIYLGYINNAPIVSGNMVAYEGQTPVQITRVQGIVEANTIKEAVTTAITQTVTNSSSKVTTTGADASVSASIFGINIKANADHTVVRTIENSNTRTLSIVDTFESATTEISKTMDIVSVTIGAAGEPSGRYRWTLFATTDVYLTVRLKDDNTVLVDHEFAVCARPDSYTWNIDYDSNMQGSFPRTGGGGLFPLPDDFSMLPPVPQEFRFVAAGINGRMAHSNDGITWTPVQTGVDHWNGVAFGGNTFIAVGNNGQAAFSNNGINWETKALIDNRQWNSVAFSLINGSRTWVAVGNTGSIAYSIDNGDTWTGLSIFPDFFSPIGNSNLRHYQGVIYGNDRFITVGTKGRKLHSVNGIDWTLLAHGERNYNSAAYGNGRFVSVANEGTISSSTNGIAWSSTVVARLIIPFPTSSRSPQVWYGVSYGNGLFVAVGSEYAGYGQMAYSSDGVNWTIINVGTATWHDVAYGNIDGTDRWVAVGHAPGNVGWMAYSDDGINWTTQTVGTNGFTDWRTVTFGKY